MANKQKKWDEMTGEEKTKAQAIELVMMEQGKRKKEMRDRERKWESMTGEEKTKQQAVELFLFEQELQKRQGVSFFDGLEEACDNIWNKMSGIEKTRQQEIELFMLEQGKPVKENKNGRIIEDNLDTKKEIVRRRVEFFEKSQEAKKRALEEQMRIEGKFQKDYEVEKEFTPVGLVRAVSVLHHDDGMEHLPQKKEVKLYVSKHEAEAEKALRRGARGFDPVVDAKEREQRDLEISKLQGAIINAFAHGYDAYVEEK